MTIFQRWFTLNAGKLPRKRTGKQRWKPREFFVECAPLESQKQIARTAANREDESYGLAPIFRATAELMTRSFISPPVHAAERLNDARSLGRYQMPEAKTPQLGSFGIIARSVRRAQEASAYAVSLGDYNSDQTRDFAIAAKEL